MDISVLLATYAREDILKKTLKSFVRLHTDDLTWELVVIDNACLDSTQTIVESYSHEIDVTYLRQAAPGKNSALLKGMQIAKGDLLVFTDDDVIADENWLQALFEGSIRHSEYDLFGGKITPHFPDTRQLDPIIDLQHPISKVAFVDLDLGDKDIPMPASQVWGPNMAVRRRVFEAGFTFDPSIGPSQNPKYTMGSEASLLIPAEAAGFKAIYLPDANVLHQIRPEQMSLTWLKGRALRMGKGKAANSPNLEKMPFFLGIPRFLYRKLVTLYVQKTIAKAIGNRNKAFDLEMSYWSARGVAHYFMHEHPLETNQAQAESPK
ncbi:glycosyl transferase family 2 [Halospina denitrificans]|uniref:Glycosyl transferase family 2 n=1 Tax=Halospina denitrificans TaxID=332522 RepID=A0A4R7JN29_9GAMM|nr:glycosyltransferase family 2 protein [Halospina denitrificans]TDT39490.1 glycosyl transferase family 2 [Halospina denitrificans]